MTTTGSNLGGSSVATRAGVVLIVIHAFMISTGLLLIAGMLSAAAAFTGGLTITIFFVSSFQGSSEVGTSPAMTLTGSWFAAAVLVATLTVALSLLIKKISRLRDVRNSRS